jgi:arylformamidase
MPVAYNGEMSIADQQIIDLTMPIRDGMDAFPGEPTAGFTRFSSIDDGGVEMWSVRLFSQLGTHVDAPSHFLEGGATVESLPLAHGIGTAVVVDVATPSIDVAALAPHETRIRAARRVVLRTGWDRHVNSPAYWEGSPELTAAGAEALVRWGVTFVGLDVPTPTHSDLHRVHRILLSAGVLIAECLVGVAALADEFTIVCLPLPLVGLDGSPARVIALQGEARQ